MRVGILLMKARAPQNEAKVPFKVDLPLKLRNFVSSKNKKLTEKGCLHEFTLVTSCLEKNNYENKLCTREVDDYHKCYKNYMHTTSFNKKAAMDGKLRPGARDLQHKQVNQLLKKFPVV